MFRKLLVAKRGEIAYQVIRTARKMSNTTVTVDSDGDRNARQVDLADAAVHIGPAPSRDSYLRDARIIAVCRRTGAEAVHPGYGFLSENAKVARQVEEAGIVFIRPKCHLIAAMGEKLASKRSAKHANANIVPGWNDAFESPESVVEIASGIGYPVMIKASDGGGDKGLQVAHDDKEAFDGFSSCKNEARNSFGDARVIIEKFVEEPRHIEIQALGDAYGNLTCPNERESSFQRRHHKVIEEAPSLFITDEARRTMGEQTVALAKAVRYESTKP